MKKIILENLEVSGFTGALRGMRNPKNSWDKSDSDLYNFNIGEKDMTLVKTLTKAGPEHRKFLRMIHVCFDVELPMYVLKEMDTYKIGVTCNSCSTMHKLGSRPLTIDDFAIDAEVIMARGVRLDFGEFLAGYNKLMALWKHTIKEDDKKDYWRLMVQWLPMCYIQRRTYDMDYETILNIIHQRKDHKLKEWHEICDEFLTLPYMKELYEAMESKDGNR